MANYVGSYSNRWIMELFVREGKLFLKRFGAELPVTKIGEHRFSVTSEGASEAQNFCSRRAPTASRNICTCFFGRSKTESNL